MQGPFQFMPYALRSVAVEGIEKSQTVSVTGTWKVTPPVTITAPVYVPAGAEAGTWMSTNTARLWPAGTSKGKAFRFSPMIGSMLGISASGQTPAAPSPPVGCVTVIRPSRYSVRSRPLIEWPLPSLSDSKLIATAVAAPVTTTWNDSNSFFAAASTAAAVVDDCACGRIFTADGATHTVAALDAPAATPTRATTQR